jgi:hypothetical protein
MPYQILLYVVAYLVRVNVSCAALEMKVDLGFTAEMPALGAGIFLLEVPGAVIAQRLGVPARFKSLPPDILTGNPQQQFLPQTDLFGAQHDDT